MVPDGPGTARFWGSFAVVSAGTVRHLSVRRARLKCRLKSWSGLVQPDLGGRSRQRGHRRQER
jgi:hypothetical protein